MTIEIDLNNADLKHAIEAQLKTQGEPLRWAITAVHQGSAQVEAVVLQNFEAE